MTQSADPPPREEPSPGDPAGRAAPREVEIDVPRLPRGRGLRLSGPQLFRIVATLALLIFVIVAQKPCAGSVSKFVTGFGSDGSAAAIPPRMPTPGTVDVPSSSGGSAGSAGPGSLDSYERLRPGMTDDEIKAAIERARARAGSAQ